MATNPRQPARRKRPATQSGVPAAQSGSRATGRRRRGDQEQEFDRARPNWFLRPQISRLTPGEAAGYRKSLVSGYLKLLCWTCLVVTFLGLIGALLSLPDAFAGRTVGGANPFLFIRLSEDPELAPLLQAIFLVFIAVPSFALLWGYSWGAGAAWVIFPLAILAWFVFGVLPFWGFLLILLFFVPAMLELWGLRRLWHGELPAF